MYVGAKGLSSRRGIEREIVDQLATLLAAVLCLLAAAGEVRGQEAVNGLTNGQTGTVIAALQPAPVALHVPNPATQAEATTTAHAQSDPNDPMAPHDPGIYYIQQSDGGRRMILLEPAPLAVTAGGSKWTATISGSQAQIRVTDGQPTFYFYIPPNQMGFPGVPSGGSSVTSPREFTLARLETTKKEREVPLEKVPTAHRGGLMGVAGGRGKRGSDAQELQAQRASLSVRDKDQVPFAYDKVATGIYKVQPQAELKAGEYGFLYSGSLQMADGRLFDFGIDKVK